MAKTGMALSIIGGLLILISGLAAFGGIMGVIGYYVTGATGYGLAVLFGLIVLIGGWWSGKPGKESMAGILSIVFSLLALLVGGGWIIGSILGIIGGIMVWKKK